MTLSCTKIRRELASMQFSTAHARICQANAITHLLTYQRSVASGGEMDLSALFAVYNYLSWLSDHVHEIDDKQVLPSQRMFLADAMTHVFDIHESCRGV